MGVRRPELVLAAAIAVSLPMLLSFMSGAISAPAALLRFAIALALCWALGAAIERVYDAYARQARSTAIRKQLEEARRQHGGE
ncbi:MAG: hypothetical protein ACP5PM_00085 [Acidimicrobiales bacterium]